MYDTLIKNGLVVDGTKSPAYKADIGITGKKISQVGNFEQANALNVIDAKGKVIVPGFIDTHSHSDYWLLKYNNFFPKTSQGITSEFIMLDGISYAPVSDDTIFEWIYYLRSLNGLPMCHYSGWKTIKDYLNLLTKTSQNIASFAPYANIRSLVCGFKTPILDDYQMREIKLIIKQSLEEGAFGISTGLDYISQWNASKEEIISACKEMQKIHGVYVTHIRSKVGILEGIKEAVEIGRKAEVPVHLSHLKCDNSLETEQVLTYIEEASLDVDITFDIYPYASGSTMLHYLLPIEVWSDGPFSAITKLRNGRVLSLLKRQLDRIPLHNVIISWVGSKQNSVFQGKSILDFIRATQKSPEEAVVDLLIEEAFAVLVVFKNENDELIRPFLCHSKCMLASDGIFQEDGYIHPREFGTTTKFLQNYVKEQGLLSLENAIYKMSSFPAERFGVRSRGFIKEGDFADLVILDMNTISDQATYENPRKSSVGIDYVFVNGVEVIRDGEPLIKTNHAESGPGMILSYGKIE